MILYFNILLSNKLVILKIQLDFVNDLDRKPHVKGHIIHLNICLSKIDKTKQK